MTLTLNSPSFTTSSPAFAVVQKPLPIVEYSPTPQTTQVVPSALALPATHCAQLLKESTSSTNFPGPQDSQFVAPALLKKSPAQFSLVPPTQAKPASHSSSPVLAVSSASAGVE